MTVKAHRDGAGCGGFPAAQLVDAQGPMRRGMTRCAQTQRCRRRSSVQASGQRPVKRALKEETMHNLLDVLRDVAIGASVLLGVGLLIQLSSSALQLVAMR
jgi:hypothetical protein